MVDIRPETTIYSIFRHINYKKWNAIAEFVDNSIQSFLERRELLDPERVLRIDIDTWRDESGVSYLRVNDNSFGIAECDFDRAFKPGSIPNNTEGLSEFGVGMKFAACFFSPNWSVTTTPYPPSKSYEFLFDINLIATTNSQEVVPLIHDIAKHPDSGTTLLMNGLYENIAPMTLAKIKSHLAGIYRCFLRDGLIQIFVNNTSISYTYPKILKAKRAWVQGASEQLEWKQDISFVLSDGKKITGFAAIRDKASRDLAGFALFRRGRVVVGSEDETYRPRLIFGSSGGFEYQRIFGELHLDGFDVSHTKDSIQWGDSEDELLYRLKSALESEPFLLRQAKEFRVGLLLEEKRAQHINEISQQAIENLASNNLIDKISGLASISPKLDELALPTRSNSENNNAEAAAVQNKTGSIQLPNPLVFTTPDRDWRVYLVFNPENKHDPLFTLREFSEDISEEKRLTSSFHIQINSSHRFIEKYSSLEPDSSDGLVVFIIALCVSEIKIRADGYHFTGAMRRCINELINYL